MGCVGRCSNGGKSQKTARTIERHCPPHNRAIPRDMLNIFERECMESNPLRALFKPSTGFEDQGPHQRCKDSRSPEWSRKPRHFQDFLILRHPGATVYVRLLAPLKTH